MDEPFELRNRTLAGASFVDCAIPRATFDDVDLGAAQFTNVNLRGARFTDVNLAGVTIDDANIQGLTLFGRDVGALIARAKAPPPAVSGVVPILFVRDVATAAAHYRDTLGFAIDFLHGEPPFYGAVSRGAARLHLRHVGQPNFAELAAREESLILASIEVADVRALHAELREAGADIVEPLTAHPWGGTDFHVRDPDGNRISFVQYGAESAG